MTFIVIPVWADDRTRILDEEILPLLKGGPLNVLELKNAVDKFNGTRPADALPQKKEVLSLDPLWLQTQLREKGVVRAALSLCGAELHACDDAKRSLQALTAQCSTVFLGIIDVSKYPTPRNLYDAANPELILLLQAPGSQGLVSVGLMATVNPDTIAIAMCPEESRTFGPVLRMLQR